LVPGLVEPQHVDKDGGELEKDGPQGDEPGEGDDEG
jgi:hypothetical protein